MTPQELEAQEVEAILAALAERGITPQMALLEEARSKVWPKYQKAYDRAMENGLTSLAERLEGIVDQEAQRLAQRGTNAPANEARAPSAPSSPRNSTIAPPLPVAGYNPLSLPGRGPAIGRMGNVDPTLRTADLLADAPPLPMPPTLTGRENAQPEPVRPPIADVAFSLARGIADPLGIVPTPAPYSVDRPVTTLGGEQAPDVRQDVRFGSVPEAEAVGGMLAFGPAVGAVRSAGQRVAQSPVADAARTAGQRVARSIADHPLATGLGIGGAAAVAAPSEATSPQAPTAGPQQPNLLEEIRRAFGGGSDEQRPLTQDEFVHARRRLQPRAESDFIESEVAKIRETERWQNASKGLRENLEAAARNNAREAYAGYQRSVDQESRRLGSDFSTYREGWQRRYQEMLSQPFAERHPTAATAMTIGGPIVAGLVTHGVANKIHRGLERSGQTAIDAALGGDARATAVNALRARNQLESAPWKIYGTAGKMSLLPAELRVAGDMIDRSALPPSAPARQDAERRMADWGPYATHLAQDVVSGAIGAGTGLGTAGLRRSASGPDTARTGAAYMRGIDPAMSPDDAAVIIAQRAAAATRAGNDLQSARQIGPGAAEDRRSILARMLPTRRPSGASGQTPPAPQSTSGQTLPASEGPPILAPMTPVPAQLPAPGAVPNPQSVAPSTSLPNVRPDARGRFHIPEGQPGAGRYTSRPENVLPPSKPRKGKKGKGTGTATSLLPAAIGYEAIDETGPNYLEEFATGEF